MCYPHTNHCCSKQEIMIGDKKRESIPWRAGRKPASFSYFLVCGKQIFLFLILVKADLEHRKK